MTPLAALVLDWAVTALWPLIGAFGMALIRQNQAIWRSRAAKSGDPAFWGMGRGLAVADCRNKKGGRIV